MSSEALYERYKDALKRGHVASLRGRLEEALSAYAEAAAIAPERSTPHTSAATALMRRKRPADALRHYTAALALAPRDEAAMLGRAQALAALDRPAEAADAFDALAELRATSGKLADAVDAARRGLELAEGRERRRILERLIERLRASEPDEPGRVALERALRVLEGPGVALAPAVAAPAPDAALPVAEEHAPDADEAAAAGTPTGLPGGEEAAEAPAAAGAEEAEEPEPAGAPVEAAAAEGEAAADEMEPAAAGAVLRAALDRDLPDDLDPEALATEAEDALVRDDPGPALAMLLDLAALHVRDGRDDAALDACYLALSVDPDDAVLHLALVELYDRRGWSALASEKLDLLERLAALDADDDGAGRLAAVRAARS
ncbi:MAG TPA: hypothetical protein VFY23_08230 [Candidatus Limnocylindrales bacterium]|nr:hypothetical protein [Candidatus Limnocylindrales bacterium]